MEIIECEQGSEEWYRARMGIPTASEFHTVLASGKDGGASVTRATYMMKLAGEILTGELAESYSNEYMARGKEMEAEARDLYAFRHDEEIRRVGLIINGPKGCSPDALIGEDGMLEIKTTAAHLLIPMLLKDEFPPKHKAQCQGALWVAKREWIDIGIYWPKLPMFEKRAYRDERYIADLAKAVDQFNVELQDKVERIRALGRREAA